MPFVEIKGTAIMGVQGKVAIITGASSGIGAAAAKLFAREGANVVLGARRERHLAGIVDEIEQAGGSAVYVSGDLRDEGYSRSLVETALKRFGGLDIAFNNAGVIGEMADLPSMSSEAWNETLRTNLTSAFYGAKYQIPPMVERGAGSIIFTSSFVGYTIGLPGMAAYAATKAGLIGMTQCLAVEYGPIGIRINALLPGGTRTPMAGDFSEGAPESDAIGKLHALKRMAEPEEIAEAALFLASGSASFVTGSAMLVDGGNSIAKG